MFLGSSRTRQCFYSFFSCITSSRYKTSVSPSLLFLLFKFPKKKEMSSLLYPLAADQIKHSRCCNRFSAPRWKPCIYWFVTTRVVTCQPWGQTDNHWVLTAVFHPVIILIWDLWNQSVSDLSGRHGVWISSLVLDLTELCPLIITYLRRTWQIVRQQNRTHLISRGSQAKNLFRQRRP